MVVSTGIRFPDGVPVVSTEPLSFARNEDGSLALVSGWAEPESWGAWSVERECVLRLRLSPPPGSREVRLALRYRAVPLAGEKRELDCAIGDEPATRLQLRNRGHDKKLVLEVPESALDGAVDVRFVNLNARPPSEMGIGEDHWPLGIGVEEIQLLA